MLIIKKNIAIKYALSLFILCLAFTDLYVFETERFSFSYYIIYGFLFIVGLISLRFKTPPLSKNFSILIIIYIGVSSLINFGNFKGSSVIYSFLFIFYYIFLTYYSKKYLPKIRFVAVLKYILISFFFILIISQLIVFFNLQSLERPVGYFQSTGQLGIEFNHITNTYRYYSLSSEPSYAALIVLITFAALKNFITSKKQMLLYTLMLIYMLISIKSAIGFLGFSLLIFSELKISKKYILFIFLIIFIGVLLFLFTNIGGKSIDRLRQLVFLFFTNTGNFAQNLNNIDSSAYARIGTFLNYIQQVDLLNIHAYIGNGATSCTPYFSKMVYPEVWNKDMVFKPPFISGFLYDYGFFGLVLVLSFIWRLVKKNSIFFKVVFIIIMLNSSLNTQLFWYVIVIVTLLNFYSQKNVVKKH